MKKAFITGITGQDGSYLAELLLEKGYEVHAILRRSSVFTTQRIDHILEHERLFTYHGDLSDSSSLHRLLTKIQPNEIYNLGAQSHVGVSFEVPEYTAEVVGTGAIRMLDAIRDLGLKCKYYQASTSELFGGIPGTEPQNELTPFYPKSPYGAAKLYAYWVTVNYRESYGLFACNGILFNHESPRRGETFVTKKITMSLCRIALGIENCLYLGNIYSLRDWGHARDYAEMQWKILQQKKPEDFVIATEKQYSVKFFVEECCKYLGIKINWIGKGLNEKAIVVSFNEKQCPGLKKNMTIVRIDKKYFRPLDVVNLIGNAKKARAKLGWKPKYNIKQLINEMMQFDYKNALKNK